MPESRVRHESKDLSVRASKIHGRGVFAEKAFPPGGLVLEIDDSDPVLDRSQLTPEQAISIDVFVAADGTEKVTWMQSPERFINHSCEPNTYVRTDMRTGVRQVWALRSIQEGDEITWDYALNIWEEWIRPAPCHCGSENCLKTIRGNYFTLPRQFQQKYLSLLDEPFKRRFAKEIRALHLTEEPNTM